MNTPIATSVPLNALAVVPLPGVTATAVALTFVHDYTVALVGTQQGSLLKVKILVAYDMVRVRDMVRAGCIHLRQIRAGMTCDSGGAGARW